MPIKKGDGRKGLPNLNDQYSSPSCTASFAKQLASHSRPALCDEQIRVDGAGNAEQ
jgi:hypothetical protein